VDSDLAGVNKDPRDLAVPGRRAVGALRDGAALRDAAGDRRHP